MKKIEFTINKTKYRIEAENILNGIYLIVKGGVYEINDNNLVLNFEYTFPLGFIKKFGKDIMEKEVEQSCIEAVKQLLKNKKIF